METSILIETLAAPVTDEAKVELIALLTNAVHAGASMGFLAPLPRAEAEAFWAKVIGDLAGAYRVILVARETARGGRIVGSAQLAVESRANGRHRAEVQKVMVHTASRRQGIAATLMARIEAIARERGLTLLFLDTSVGRGGAEAFYEALGYTYCGGIPGYALDPDGTPADNAIYYKRLP